MLYRNDELFSVKESKEWEEIKKSLLAKLKFPMIIKMPAYMYTKSAGNEKPDRPSNATIPLVVQKNDSNGSVKWDYCTGRDKDKKGNWQYYYTQQGSKQNRITYTDSMVITKDQIDLAYFLLEISPLRFIPGESEESAIKRGVKKSQRFQYVIEDKEAEAALKINIKKQRMVIESAIMDDDKGLSTDKLRVIAASLHIPNAELKGELELKDELLSHIELMQKNGNNGYSQFMQLSKLDKITSIRAAVQKAVDMKLIKENNKTKSYYYVKDGKEANVICSVIGARTLRESIEFFLEQNPGAFDVLEQTMKEKELATELD